MVRPSFIERYFAKHEFTAPHMLSSSDCEAVLVPELLSLVTDDDIRKRWENLSLGYTESQGDPRLRAEIAKLYTKIKMDQVLVVTPVEGIFLALRALLNRGDHVITAFPAYQALYEQLDDIGVEHESWTMRSDHRKDSWIFDIDELRKQIKPHTKMLVINFPHNPTGASLSKDEFKILIDLVREHNIILFSDEMYRFLVHDDTYDIPSACDVYERAISLFGMSKSFGLPGIRIGWLTSQNSQLLEKCAIWKDYTTICNSAPSEVLAQMALSVKEKLLAKSEAIINKNIALFSSFVDRNKDLISWHKPKAGSIAFPELLRNVSIGVLANDLVATKGVCMITSDLFEYQGNNFRIGLGRENFSQALFYLEEYLNEQF